MTNPSPAEPAVNGPPVRYTQSHREDIINAVQLGGIGGIFRKHSRILAFQENQPFEVETDRGVMRGEAGDWIVTNHPDDDRASDVWSISDERMAATYHPWDQPVITSVDVTPASVLIRHAIDALKAEPNDVCTEYAIVKLSEALLWINGPTVLGTIGE